MTDSTTEPSSTPEILYDITKAYAEQPSNVWDTVDSVLVKQGSFGEIYQGLTKEGGTITGELPDSTPQAFIQAVAPALTPVSVVPRVIPSPADKTVETTDIERANMWTGILRWTYRVARFKKIFRRALQDACAYGSAYIYVYVDEKNKRPAFEFIPHDRVAFEPGVDIVDAQWVVIKREVSKEDAEELGIPKGQEDSPDESQSDRVGYYEIWDSKNRHWYWCNKNGKSFKSGRYPKHYSKAPLFVFSFGEMPGNQYPMGLLYHWLPKLWELRKLKTFLLLNAHLVALQPVLMSEVAFTEKNAGKAFDFFGQTVILVNNAFFTDGSPKAFPLNPKQLSESFYKYVESVKEDIQKESHLSDIMQSKQLRSGISKAEVQAIVAAQTQWLQDLLDVVEMALIDGGEIVLATWGFVIDKFRKSGVKALSEMTGGKAESVPLTTEDTLKGASLELDIDQLDLDSDEERRERAKSIHELLRDPEAVKRMDVERAWEFVFQVLNAHDIYLNTEKRAKQAEEEQKKQAELAGQDTLLRPPGPPQPGIPAQVPGPSGNDQRPGSSSAGVAKPGGNTPASEQEKVAVIIQEMTEVFKQYYLQPDEAAALAEAILQTKPELAEQVLTGTPEQVKAIIKMALNPEG